jgi:hypothetical protein
VASVFEDVLSMPIGHCARLRSVLRAKSSLGGSCVGLGARGTVSLFGGSTYCEARKTIEDE